MNKNIYAASYPCWIFSNNFIQIVIDQGYKILEKFETLSSVYDKGIKDMGYIMRKDISK